MLDKICRAGIIAAGCLAFATAQAQTPQEQYAKIQLAIADVDGFDNGLALVGTYGLKMPQVHPNFSFEGELTTTISDPETSFFGTTLKASYYTLAGYGVYTHQATPKLALFGRAGLLYEDVSIDTPFGSGSSSDFGLSFGVGANVAMQRNLDFTAGLTIIESDINHISAGVNYRF